VSAPEHPLGSLASLSKRELEVLRLLASGHTVKTIAVQLGCSETAINERLRDARRKTGAASSRELARLVDAQKIWDKNIDLSTQSRPAKSVLQPAKSRLKRSKGIIIMLIAMPIAAIGLAIVAAPSMRKAATPQAAHTALSRQSPLVGSWLLDVSRLPDDGQRPRRVTFTFRLSQDQKWTTICEIVGPDGTIRQGGSTAAADGVPVPVSGNLGFVDTAALRQPAPNTLVVTLGKNGAPFSTRVYAVSKDRKSMTETIIWPGDKLPELITTYFNRIG
jgi:DNA-binding CsgD family transcriptional regulator